MVTLLIVALYIFVGFILKSKVAAFLELTPTELTDRGGIIYYLLYPLLVVGLFLVEGYRRLHELCNDLYDHLESML